MAAAVVCGGHRCAGHRSLVGAPRAGTPGRDAVLAARGRLPTGASQRRRGRLSCRAGLGGLEASPETVQAATYVTLGLSGLSFVGTFFVAPRFKEAFKEDVDWRDIYNALVAGGGVRAVEPAEAFAKSKSGGAVLVDVRLGGKYESSHAAGSLGIPLYLPISKWDAASVIRRLGFSFFGIYGTELNTSFAEDVAGRVPRGKQVYLVCENGGSLENKSGTKYGFQSRSLKAAYYLQRAGYKNVAIVRGGVSQWARDKLPLAYGPEDPAGRGRLGDDDDDEGAGGLRVGGLRLPQLSSVFSR